RRQRTPHRPGVEAGLDDEQAFVEGDEGVVEAPAEAEAHVLVRGDMALDLAARAPAQDLEPADDLLAAPLRGRRCLVQRRRRRGRHGEGCEAFGGPVWV